MINSAFAARGGGGGSGTLLEIEIWFASGGGVGTSSLIQGAYYLMHGSRAFELTAQDVTKRSGGSTLPSATVAAAVARRGVYLPPPPTCTRP